MKYAKRPYYCKYCNRIIYRYSSKKWFKSYCLRSGKNARLVLAAQEGYVYEG